MKILAFFILLSLIKNLSFSSSIFPEEWKLGNNLQITLYHPGVHHFSSSYLSGRVVYEFDDFIWIMQASGKNKTKLFSGSNPQFFPAEEIILYSDEEDIYTYDLKINQQTKIIEKGIFSKVSPDGNFIAYLNTTKFPYNLFVYNVTSKTNTQITDIERGRRIIEFCFLQNKEMAYLIGDFDILENSLKFSTTEVVVVDLEGIISYKLLKKGEAINIFSSFCGKKMGYIDQDFNLYIMDLDARKKIFISKSDEFIFSSEEEDLIYIKNIKWVPKAYFSPDAEEIIISSYDKKTKKFYLSLYKLSADKVGNIIETLFPLHSILWNKDKIMYAVAKDTTLLSPKAIFCTNFIKIFVNQKRINFELYPVKVGEEIFVPIQDIAGELNLLWSYNKIRRALRVSSSQKNIEYQINIPQAVIGNNIVKIKGPPFILLDRIIYIPLSSLFFILPGEVIFDEREETIYINCEKE